VIASDMLAPMLEAEIRLAGSIGRYNNQKLEFEPKSRADVVQPTITFHDKLTRRIGGEVFEFFHVPGETEDQIYISVPGRRLVVSADYYQGFLPNAGNGKRMQRHLEEWIGALRHMVELKPDLLLPMHGPAIKGRDEIAAALNIHADGMEHIVNQVVERLNRGERKDTIAASLDWPARFSEHALLAPTYNRPEDLAKMVAHRWTGWWDDIPSHFNALAFEEEAREAIALAGGVDAIDRRARVLLKSNPRLAARLADWAQYGAPKDPKALRLAVDVYMARIMAADTPVQETFIYFDAAAVARTRLEQLQSKAN
jgi:alkyl sulfatase BDS1-like metallo-beta-lactamase superfamily hydrolase